MQSDPDAARAAGFDPARLEVATDLLQSWALDGSVPASAIAIERHGVRLPTLAFGSAERDGLRRPTTAERVFLVASVTKPVTAIAVLQQIESGVLSLADPVQRYIPEFSGAGRQHILVEHLLTHTSGLPDMLPDNEALRKRQAPLSEFVRQTCDCELLFAAGTRVSYQSMGTLLAAEIVERLSGRPLRQLLAADVFAPLGMRDTCLGLREDLVARVADVVLPAAQVGTTYHWNTSYWQSLGAPWGGMFSTVEDLLHLLRAMLCGGAGAHGRVLGMLTARTMLQDRTAVMGSLPASARSQRWGLGWRLGGWGDFGGPRAFSHSGATGTLVGADPDSGLSCAIFTTQPGAPLHRVVTAVQAAVCD